MASVPSAEVLVPGSFFVIICQEKEFVDCVDRLECRSLEGETPRARGEVDAELEAR